MATNTAFPPALPVSYPDASVGLTILALLLALTLGLAAADIQRERALDGQATTAGEHELRSEDGGTVLDGRGKWGGYLS